MKVILPTTAFLNTGASGRDCPASSVVCYPEARAVRVYDRFLFSRFLSRSLKLALLCQGRRNMTAGQPLSAIQNVLKFVFHMPPSLHEHAPDRSPTSSEQKPDNDRTERAFCELAKPKAARLRDGVFL